MKTHRYLSALALVTATLSLADCTFGQEPRAASASPTTAQNPNDDSELAAILRSWEETTRTIRRLDCRFVRFKYDNVFGAEVRGEGRLAVDSDGRAVYRMWPAAINPGQMSRKRTADGKPYEIKADRAERWHWTGTGLIRVDEQSRTFEAITFDESPLPESDRPDPPALPIDPRPQYLGSWGTTFFAVNIVTGVVRLIAGYYLGEALASAFSQQAAALKEFVIPRLFLLSTSADELQRRYHVTLVRRDDGQIRLSFIPRSNQVADSFTEAHLLLDAVSLQPRALLLQHPGGSETVHRFVDIEINRAPPDAGNLEHPDLSGLHRLRIN